LSDLRVQNNGKKMLGGVTGNGFRPGRSGNPGGRPRGLARSVRELVGDDGLAIVEFWLSVMNDTSAKTSDRLKPSQLIADRGWGRVSGAVVLDDEEADNDADIEEASEFFRSEVLRLAALHEAERNADGSTVR
jgi:hypothetical protein